MLFSSTPIGLLGYKRAMAFGVENRKGLRA
jgi:hypothetical protein